MELVANNTLTKAEMKSVQSFNGSSQPFRTIIPEDDGCRKPQAWDKCPDPVFTITNPISQDVMISVVFGVEFSVSYEDLDRDAKQWLLRCSDEVQVVVLVNIKEDKGPLVQKKDTFDKKSY